MFKKYVIPITVLAGMLMSMVIFIFTSDIRFGFLATWFVLAFYHETSLNPINIILEAPKNNNKQEDSKHEGDCHRD